MKSIEECYEALYKAYDISCKPTMEKVRKGDIIDEDKSVKWNREEVERRIKARDDEVKRLNKEKNEACNKARTDLYKAIKRAIKGISDDSARAIYDYIYEQEDGESMQNHIIAMYDLIDLISNCIGDTKKK